jgi:hypothetical protein
VIDVEDRIRATFAHVAKATEIPPMPQFDPFEQLIDPQAQRPRRALRRRRIVVTATTTFIVLGGGLSIAAGLPVLPHVGVMQKFGWSRTPSATYTDPTVGRLILTITGPDGQPMKLWYTELSDDRYCVALVRSGLEPPSPSRDSSGRIVPVPAAGGSCGIKDETTFGGEGVWISSGSTADPRAVTPPVRPVEPYEVLATNSPTAFAMRVPGAISARVAFRDGTRTDPLPIEQGWTAGWITDSQTQQDPKLVGYDAQGNVIGQTPLYASR